MVPRQPHGGHDPESEVVRTGEVLHWDVETVVVHEMGEEGEVRVEPVETGDHERPPGPMARCSSGRAEV
jgi:hypothetical protein